MISTLIWTWQSWWVKRTPYIVLFKIWWSCQSLFAHFVTDICRTKNIFDQWKHTCHSTSRGSWHLTASWLQLPSSQEPHGCIRAICSIIFYFLTRLFKDCVLALVERLLISNTKQLSEWHTRLPCQKQFRQRIIPDLILNLKCFIGEFPLNHNWLPL